MFSLIKWLIAVLSLGRKSEHDAIILPPLDHLDLNNHIYSPILQNDFLSIPADKDLTAWRQFTVKFLPETAELSNIEQYRVIPFPRLNDAALICYLPKEPILEKDVQLPTENEKEKMIKLALKALHNKDCISHREGWWTYQVCHLKHVRQYHVVTASERAEAVKNGKDDYPSVGSISSNYLLGRYLPNSDNSTNVRFGNVFAMNYQDGDRCWTDDRGVVQRSVEIRFRCSPNRLTPHFIDVFEDQICHYVVVIGTPSLCSIPSFLEWARPSQTIFCLGPQNTEVAGDADKSDDSPHDDHKKQRRLWLDRISGLIESGESFPLLKRAIWDLLQTEYGASIPDSLASHQPKKSLYDVFTELKESSPTTSSKEKKGRYIIKIEQQIEESKDIDDDDGSEKKSKKDKKRIIKEFNI